MPDSSVSIVMGSKSDLEIAKRAEQILDSLGVAHETQILSAHRNHKELDDYLSTCKAKVFIAIAGLAARTA